MQTSFGRLFLVALFAACSADIAPVASSLETAPLADVLEAAPGVIDRGYDPAVVAVESDGQLVCAGAIIAPDVVLTARHCVPWAAAVCPPRSSGASRAPLTVRMAVDGAIAATSIGVRDVVEPSVCDADLALLRLDAPVTGASPMRLRGTGVAQGDHVRTVGFALQAGGTGAKVVRDHVLVLAATVSALALQESPCELGCGGPVVDESTAEIVGIELSTWATARASQSPGNRAFRTDPWLPFVDTVLAAAQSPPAGGPLAKTVRGPVDLGGNCDSAARCAAGVCVDEATRRYCSRTCSPSDPCPARSRCESTLAGARVCIDG
jgi:hypothetical protein